MPEKNINQPRIGMKFSNPQDLKDTEFSLLVNGQIESVNGNFFKVTNSHSNILCNRLNGYKVLGTFYLPSQQITFYFLVNPITRKSEIGFIKDQVNKDKKDKVVHCSDCNNPIVEDTPLEEYEQIESCTYTTFVNADCLNFNIDYPISSWVKVDDCNIRMYFTDGLNRPRYIDYDDFQKVTIDNCPLLESNELDCDKIKIFPETCYPEVVVTDVVSGGQNTSGVYQFTACYSDVRANKITDCFYVSNPTPLFNLPITIDEEYPVSKSIKINISNLNKDFKYFNLYVLKTIKGVTTPYLIETFEINSSVFSYIYTGIQKNISQNIAIDEILSKRPHYIKAKTLSESNGYLTLSTLSENRILNLQPVINKLPVYWQSVILDEGDYANPIIATNNVGYLGDETYPLAIEFSMNNSTKTARFHIPGRHYTDYDREIISNDDVIEVNGCEIDPRNQRWQVYNTASILGSSTTLTTLVQQSLQYDCTSIEFEVEVTWIPDPFFPNDPTKETFTQVFKLEDGTVLTEQELVDLCDCTNPYIDDVNMQNQSNPPIKLSPILTSDFNLFLGKDVNGEPIVNPASPFTLVSKEGIVNVNSYDGYLVNKFPLTPKKYSGNQVPCLANDCEFEDEDGNSQVITGWLSTKDNYDCSNATTLPQATKERCTLDTWGSFVPNQQSQVNSDYRDHRVQVLGALPSGYSAGLALNDSNQTWYSFTATTPVVAIEVNTTNSVAIEIWKNTCPPNNTGLLTTYTYGSPLFPSNFVYFNNKASLNGLFLLSKDTTNNQQDLEVGAVYYVKVYSDTYVASCPDETCILCTLPNPDCYFRICVNTPTPTKVEQEYKNNVVYLNCLFQLDYEVDKIVDNYCNVQNYQYGLMSYWESTERYPCNEEVYGELAGQPIRHHKLPDFSIAPFYEKNDYSVDLTPNTNKIFPKGIVISVKDIKQLLLEAEEKGLITEEERLSICGYRVLRGNRRGNESIIGKGLVYDIWEYRDNVYNTGKKVMFPNFPFNDNRENTLVQTKKIKTKSDLDDSLNLQHPFSDKKNFKYTFHSPNTSFNNPALGTEIKLECEQTGIAIGSYQTLKNNTNYQYLGAGVISASIGFASVEAAFEGIQTVLNATLTLPVTVFGSGTSIPLGLILAIVYENILSPVRLYSFYADWLEIIRKFAPFRNYAMYYIAQGNYDDWSKDDTGKSTVVEGNIRRAIGNTQYAKDGILNVKTEVGYQKLNNFQRESSVFVETRSSNGSRKYFDSPVVEDNSRWIPDSGQSCSTKARTTTISSYYAAIKNLLLDQYGQIDNIDYIDTGYNGRIEWNNDFQDTTQDTIFGGDTYINRFSLKRKAPLFLDDRVYPSDSITVPADNLDINLSEIPNIAYPKYFMNYPTALDYSDGVQELFGDVAVQSDFRMDFNFLCYSASGTAWAKTGLAAAILGGVSAGSAGIISLPITVGIISGTVKKNLGNDVYLNGKYIHSLYGISSFLVESNYNLDYRHGEDLKAKNFYPNVADIVEWTQQTHVPIYQDNYYFYNKDYSKQNKENLGFILNNDFKQTKEDCKVEHPNRTINSLQDNDQNDRFDGNLIFLANNYNESPKSAGKLKLVKGLDNGRMLLLQENGYAIANSYISQESNIAQSTVGTNTLFNKALPVQYIKTDLGFGGTQTSAFISTEFGSFWMDNLRGHVLNLTDSVQNIVQPEDQWWFKEHLPFKILEDFPEVDIDNCYKYFGNAIVYDARFKRVLFTKRDAKLKEEWRGLVEYRGDFFYDTINKKNILPTNNTYFCNKSFTISYSPLTKSFVSFHSFTPNYYTPNQNYFSSGINFSTIEDPSENGVWNHGLTNKSFQVYYGKLYPYIVEYSLASKAQNKVLNNIESITEFRRFQDNLSSAMHYDKFFNKALIYNQNQTTGLLELVVKDKNNLFQFTQYPNQKPNSREILTENIENIFRFNDFYNVALNQNGQPIMYYPCHIPYSELNPESITYKPQYLKDLMRSDWMSIRLINDKYSNYQISTRFTFNQTTNSNS